MKIFAQQDINDCGVSITQTLINHFHNKNINRQEIYDEANITEKGISILELEKLNKNYGIILDSYQINFEEFKNLKINDFFILIIDKKGEDHYVIAKKYKNYIQIYDSFLGKIKVKFSELQYSFKEKIIFINHVDKNIQLTAKKENKLNFLNYSFLFKNFFVDLIIFGFVMLGYLANKSLFMDVIYSNYLHNLWIIGFLSVFLYLSWSVAKYIKEILSFQHKEYYLKNFYQYLFEKLENKKNYFFSKLGKDQFYNIGQYILNLSIFYSEHLNTLLINIFISIIVIINLLLININFFLVILFSLLFQIIYYLCIKKNKEEYSKKSLLLQAKQKKIFFNLHNFLNDEWNQDKYFNINHSLKQEVINEILLEKNTHHKNVFISKINFFIVNLFNLSLYIVAVLWYFQMKVDISVLILASLLYAKINSSFQKIISVFFDWNIFKYSLQIYKNYIFNDNIAEDNHGIEMFLPEVINIKNLNYHSGEKQIFNNLNLTIKNNTFIFGKSGIGKSTLYKLISNKISKNQEHIYFDNVKICDIKQKTFNHNLIYQNANSNLSDMDWNLLFTKINPHTKKIVIEHTKNMDISIDQNINCDKISSGQKQFLNIINLLKYSGKILLLDEITSHINKEHKLKIYAEIFPLICAKNFVICSEHNEDLKIFFDNCINLNETLLIS